MRPSTNPSRCTHSTRSIRQVSIFTEADMAQAHNAGFTRVHTPLEEGVERYVRDFLTREDPYR